MFAKELQKRGLNDAASPSKEVDFTTATKDPFAASTSTSFFRSPSATKASPAQSLPFEDGGDQRQRSMALVTEGLEVGAAGMLSACSLVLAVAGPGRSWPWPCSARAVHTAPIRP
jgi:hypothetical protein